MIFLTRILFLYIIIFKIIEATAHNEIKEAENYFRHLFKLRRAEQLVAVKRIKRLDTEEKQKKMVKVVAETIFTMMRNSKFVLENSGFVPGVSDFTVDENIGDALSNLLQNTALIGDIILRFPDISHSLLSAHNDWVVLLSWSLQFANQTNLLDIQTTKLIDLVSQEMNFTTRSDDYINPYRYSHLSEKGKYEKTIELTPHTKKKKKSKDTQRGPRLSSRGIGEL